MLYRVQKCQILELSKSLTNLAPKLSKFSNKYDYEECINRHLLKYVDLERTNNLIFLTLRIYLRNTKKSNKLPPARSSRCGVSQSKKNLRKQQRRKQSVMTLGLLTLPKVQVLVREQALGITENSFFFYNLMLARMLMSQEM